MKTFFIIFAAWGLFFLYSCNKNEPQGYGQEEFCNCGVVCEDGIDSKNNCYWLLVENECSGSKKKFCVDQLVWSAYFKGERICINQESPW